LFFLSSLSDVFYTYLWKVFRLILDLNYLRFLFNFEDSS